MFVRRSLHSFAAMAAIAIAGQSMACGMFKPIDPNSSAPKPAARPAEKPAEKPAATAPSGSATKAPTTTTKATAKPVSNRELRSNLNDRNIAAMVMALNNTDISYARLAPSRAERPDIKEFAARMLTDHTGVNGLVNDLLAKLNVVPEDNTQSLDLRDESANRRDAMRDLQGYPFDSTYIENEVLYHQKFLVTLDSLMLPAARNTELKGLLTAVRPAVAAHLAHAEQVRANVYAKQ